MLIIPVVMTSASQLLRLADSGNFLTWDRHLLAPNVVAAIFYPEDEQPLGPVLSMHLNVTRCNRPPIDGCTRYETPFANSVLLCPTFVDWVYGNNASAARATHLSTFCGYPRMNGEYIVANKWYTWPMLRHPIMSRFDFFAKIDVDVCLRAKIDVVGEFVASGRRAKSSLGAFFLHTKLMADPNECEQTLGDFMRQYTAAHPCGASAQTDAVNALVPFGNFIGGWLGFWQRFAACAPDCSTPVRHATRLATPHARMTGLRSISRVVAAHGSCTLHMRGIGGRADGSTDGAINNFGTMRCEPPMWATRASSTWSGFGATSTLSTPRSTKRVHSRCKAPLHTKRPGWRRELLQRVIRCSLISLLCQHSTRFTETAESESCVGIIFMKHVAIVGPLGMSSSSAMPPGVRLYAARRLARVASPVYNSFGF